MIYKEYELGNIILQYIRDVSTNHVSMVLLPKGKKSNFENRRKYLKHKDIVCPAWDVGNLCHLSLRHHAQGNGAGCTLKYGDSTNKLQYKSQEIKESENEIKIITLLTAEEGYEVKHIVTYTKGETGIEVETCFINHSGKTLILDMISSFVLDNLSPFQIDDAAYKLKLHRFRSGWCREGKHVENSIEELNLEGVWIRAFPESERFGVLGSFPVKRWFPFACVEDVEHQVYWAVQLATNSSWQIELSRDGDCYSLSGGLPDSEFGSWWKEIENNSMFWTPKAYLSVSDRGFADVCQNITDVFQKYVDKQPEREKNLPIIFNEWCTTWGNPTHETIVKIADKLRGLPVEYLVIDAGWSKKYIETDDPQEGNGDWVCDYERFPGGILETAKEVKKRGLSLGIWMEFEVTTKGAKVSEELYNTLHLYRNNQIIQTGRIRRFWDFRKPEVIAYLKEKVIDFLKKNEVEYLKVDYNGSIGSGCDGAESLGEGLRQQMQAVHNFFLMIRQELPNLVIENCASGGHRLEPMMVTSTAMSSFSDAHECVEIPYIASNLHQLILPRQSQIWAVITSELNIKEIRYRLISSMLGRFCLSGDIYDLKEEKWEEVKKAMLFYEKVKGVIKNGRTKYVRKCTDNQNYLKGSQVIIRENEREKLFIYHSFGNDNTVLSGAFPESDWEIVDYLGNIKMFENVQGDFKIVQQGEWEAFAIYFKKLIK